MTDKKEERELLIVQQLPTEETRTYTSEDGKEYDLMTASEALKEILLTSRELKKGMVGA